MILPASQAASQPASKGQTYVADDSSPPLPPPGVQMER